MSEAARQLIFVRKQRDGVHDMANWWDWDDECRHLAQLILSGEADILSHSNRS